MKDTTDINLTTRKLQAEHKLSNCQCTECDCPIEGLHDADHFVCTYCKAGKHIALSDQITHSKN